MTEQRSLSADSTAELRRLMDGPWAAQRELARKLAERPLFAAAVGSTMQEQRERTYQQLMALCAEGVTGIGFPAEFGGGGDIGGSIIAFEMLAMGELSLMVKAGVQFGLFGGAVLHLGSRDHHQRYLADIASGRLLGCFAMTEHGHGSDVAALRTTATYDPATEEFVIDTPDDDARKDYIGNAARDGRMAVVFAQLVTAGESHGVHAFLVPIRDADGQLLPGVRAADCGVKAGLNGVDNGQLWFDGVRVGRSALLDRFGSVAASGAYSTPIANQTKRFFTMLGTLIQGRVSVAGGAGAATKVALSIAIRYALRRTQFQAPGRSGEVVLMDYLAHQRKLLPALATSFALHFAQAELVSTLDEVFSGGDPDDPRRRELETRAAGVKAIATWHASQTIQTCREACGGAGYLAENRLAGLKADTDVFTTFEGDNTVLLQLVAKELLTRYRDHFGELDMLGTIRFVAGQAVAAVLERGAARPLIERLRSPARRAAQAAWSDRSWQLALFGYREQHLLAGLARRLRKAAGADDPFEIFNACQDHLLSTAQAHVHRLLLESFSSAVESCADEQAAKLLGQVCDLFALSVLDSERAWYLEHGGLSTARSRQLAGELNRRCAALAPYAGELVDAFGVPEAALRIPLLAG